MQEASDLLLAHPTKAVSFPREYTGSSDSHKSRVPLALRGTEPAREPSGITKNHLDLPTPSWNLPELSGTGRNPSLWSPAAVAQPPARGAGLRRAAGGGAARGRCLCPPRPHSDTMSPSSPQQSRPAAGTYFFPPPCSVFIRSQGLPINPNENCNRVP